MKTTPLKDNRTYVQKKGDLKAQWHLIDVADLTLGRVATEISQLLIGKHKPTYTPHLNNGDFVIVINSQQIALSGQKEDEKIYYRHSGYIGNLKQRTVAEQRQRDARKIIYKSVYGMLPKNKLRAERLNRLKIYLDDQHTHHGQKPIPFKLKSLKKEAQK